MNTLLWVHPSASLDTAPESTLHPAGFTVVGHTDCVGMVRKTSELAPTHVLVVLDSRTQTFVDALAEWADAPPAAIGLVSAPLGAPLHERLAAAGVHAWAPLDGFGAEVAQALLAQAGARWQREAELRRALANSLAQLEERKWIERAKGLLMSARNIGEDEAFGLLRNASMHANLRLGEVSRSVLDAARWAEAVNRAGQLRMLSQRLVKVAAQRLAKVATRSSRSLYEQSSAWVERNLERLAGLALNTADSQARLKVDAAWSALKAALEGPLSAATLPFIDDRAETLLQAADALTIALETSSGRRALRIVNICGGQRMRAHRLAKDALLTSLLPQGPWVARLSPTIEEFEAALLDLERAPLSSPDTRAALVAARDEWLRLVRGTQSASTSEGRAILARGSETLADTFDTLTAAYEHSLQVIMS